MTLELSGALRWSWRGAAKDADRLVSDLPPRLRALYGGYAEHPRPAANERPVVAMTPGRQIAGGRAETGIHSSGVDAQFDFTCVYSRAADHALRSENQSPGAVLSATVTIALGIFTHTLLPSDILGVVLLRRFF